jgi:hypothetical protein
MRMGGSAHFASADGAVPIPPFACWLSMWKEPEQSGELRSHFKTGRSEYDNAMNCRATPGGNTWRGEVSPRNNGEPFASISPNPSFPAVVDARVWMIGAVSRVSCGSCGPGPNGADSPGGMAVPVRAGAGSRPGKRAACCSRSGGPSWPDSTTRKSCAGMSVLLMAVSSRRKRGDRHRQDQSRQGLESHDCG